MGGVGKRSKEQKGNYGVAMKAWFSFMSKTARPWQHIITTTCVDVYSTPTRPLMPPPPLLPPPYQKGSPQRAPIYKGVSFLSPSFEAGTSTCYAQEFFASAGQLPGAGYNGLSSIELGDILSKIY